MKLHLPLRLRAALSAALAALALWNLNAPLASAENVSDENPSAVLLALNLVWNGGSGVWNETELNWLNGTEAVAFTADDSVTFATPGAEVTVQGDKITSGVSLGADTRWLGTAVVTAPTLSGTGTLTTDSGITLQVTESAAGVALDGSGTLVLPVGSTALGVSLAPTWSGTVALNRGSDALLGVTNFNLNAYGGAGATVELTALRGYMPSGTHVFAPDVVLLNSPSGTLAGLEINNGYTNADYTFAGSISGTGNLVAGYCGSGPNTLTFEGDLSGWTGQFLITASTRNILFRGAAVQTGAEWVVSGGTTTFGNEGGMSIRKLSQSGGTLNLTGGLVSETVLYQNGAGTLHIGTEGAPAIVTVPRVESGDARSGNASVLTVAAGSVLKVTGADVAADAYKTSGMVLGEWNVATNLTVDGTLLSPEATMQPGDTGYSLTIGSGGVAAVKGIGNPTTAKSTMVQGIRVSVNGGKLILGAGGMDSTHEVQTTLTGASLGISADAVHVTEPLALAGGNTFFDTAKYTYTETGVVQGAEGGTLTLSGVLSGDGSLTKQGAGTLVLAAANTYGGGTSVAAGTLSVAAADALGAGGVSVDGGVLALDAAESVSMGPLTMNAGTLIFAGAEMLDVDGSVVLNGGTLDVSRLSVPAAEGETILGTVTGAVSVGAVSLTGLSESVLSRYNAAVGQSGEHWVLTLTDKVIPLYWNVGSGTWNSEPSNTIWGTVGDDVSADTPYAPYAQVTICGSEGGTITVSGAQTASSLTVAHSGYTLTRGGTADSLTVEGDLTVKENVSATMAFLPAVGGNMAVENGAVLDFTPVGGNAVLAAVLAKGTGAGTIRVQGAGMVTADYTLRTHVEAVGDVWLGGPSNAPRTVEIPEGSSLSLSGSLTAASSAELLVSGGLLAAEGGLVLGHETAAQIYKGTLRMSAGEVSTPFIRFAREDTANVVDISGGTLRVTGETAFPAAGALSTVAIAGAELTNGSTDMDFNHAATFTDAVVRAQGTTMMTLGGAGLTTAAEGTLTTHGKVRIDGVTSLSGEVVLNSGEVLQVARLDAAGATLTTTGAGVTALEGGTLGRLVVQAATEAGALAVQEVSGSGVLTQQAGTALLLQDGGTLGGSVTLGRVEAQGDLSKVGDGVVSTGNIAGSGGGLTVESGTLAVAGNLSGLSLAAVEAGAALTVTGDAELSSLALGGVAATPMVRFGSLSAAALEVDVPIAVLHEYFDGVPENSVTIAVLGTPTAAVLSLLNTQGGGYDYAIAEDALGHIVISRTYSGVVWVGGEGAVWEQGSSWEGGQVPGLHSNVSFVGKGVPLVRIAEGGVEVGSVSVTGSETVSADYAFVGGSLAAENLLVENGRLSIGNASAFETAHVAETGALTVQEGAALAVGELDVQGTLAVAGTLEVGSGTIHRLEDAGDVYGRLLVQEDVTVEEDAAVGTLTLGSGSTLRVLGTLALHGAASAAEGSTLEAGQLDLTDPSAAATLSQLRAGHITLGGFERLQVTELLADTEVTLESDLRGYAPGEYTLVDSTTGHASLDNLAELNAALIPQGRKLEPLTDRTGLVLRMLDYRYAALLGLTETGRAGLGMADAAAAVGADPAGDLAAVLAHLDALRESGTAAARAEGDRLGAALSGASAAAMGAALSADAGRQLRAMRNRTTGMGVNQAVVNEDMPYFNAWVNAEGDYRELSADGTRPGYRLGQWGGTLGFDADCTPSFTCGLAATALYGDFDAESADAADGELDTYYLTVFGRYEKHRWMQVFVAAAGLADTRLRRRADGARVTGDSAGYQLGCLYELGYVFALNEEASAILQPVVNLAYTHTALDGYTEKGSDIALRVGDVSQDLLSFGLGARAQSAFGESVYNRCSLLEARALLTLEAGDRCGKVSTSFARYPGAATTKSAAFGVLGGEFGAGVIVPLGAEGGSLFMDASAEIRADWVNVNGTVGYRMSF